LVSYNKLGRRWGRGASGVNQYQGRYLLTCAWHNVKGECYPKFVVGPKGKCVQLNDPLCPAAKPFQAN
jgi:hypothetical protein